MIGSSNPKGWPTPRPTLLALVALVSLSCAPAASQSIGSFERVVAPFPVLDEAGEHIEFPFLGGVDVPRPQFVDIDGDGDLDLFLQQRTDDLAFFENVGTRDDAVFEWRTDRYQDLTIGDWSRFVDMDADGDIDLFTEERYSYIRAYENQGSSRDPRFVKVADSIRGPDGVPIFSDRQNIPFFVDLDCDERLDLFLGRIDGTVSRLEAVSPAQPGQIPSFRLSTDRFEEIEIVAEMGSLKHGANSMVFTDLDRDSDLDLLWGDFFEPGLLFIENIGNCWSTNMRVDPVPLPAVEPLATSGYNASAVGDLDGDGVDELFMGVLGGAFNPLSTAIGNFQMYKEGAGGRFEGVTEQFLGNVDFGSETIPALGDLDGDGDLDLLVGSKSDPDSTAVGRLYHFENVGNETAPTYRLRGHLPISTQYHQAPALADLDADGDLDLMLGNWRSSVSFWRNESEGGEPQFVLVDSMAATLPRGSNTVPALGDLDNDGDLDLLIGETAGNLNFFRNIGNAEEPRFELVQEELGQIDAGRRATPFLIDVDGDGDLDLLLGSSDGPVRLMENQGQSDMPEFVYVPEFELSSHPYSAVAVADVDGDGDLDIVAGAIGGGIPLF